MMNANHPSVVRMREQLKRALDNQKVDDALVMAVAHKMSLRVTLKVSVNGSVRFAFSHEDPNGS